MSLEQATSTKLLYTVKELQEILGVKRTVIYRLIKTQGFPKILINRTYYFPKEQLEKWVNVNIGKELIV